MEKAERNLATALMHEHIAGKKVEEIKYITRQLAEALQHLHSKGVLHGK